MHVLVFKVPVSAFHAVSEEKEFLFHGAIYPKVKFWGKSIEFQPKGVLTVELPLTGEVYTWSNVNCVVHNIIMGTLWMEHTGKFNVEYECYLLVDVTNYPNCSLEVSGRSVES